MDESCAILVIAFAVMGFSISLLADRSCLGMVDLIMAPVLWTFQKLGWLEQPWAPRRYQAMRRDNLLTRLQALSELGPLETPRRAAPVHVWHPLIEPPAACEVLQEEALTTDELIDLLGGERLPPVHFDNEGGFRESEPGTSD